MGQGRVVARNKILDLSLIWGMFYLSVLFQCLFVCLDSKSSRNSQSNSESLKFKRRR